MRQITPFALSLLLVVGCGAVEKPARIPSSPWVPMDLHRDRYIYVTGEVDGAPCEMLLDTGAAITLIDRKFARSIGIRGQGNLRVRGVGGDHEATLVLLDIAVGPTVLVRAPAASLDLGAISHGLGRDTMVVLGTQILAEAVVDIDYPYSRVGFHDPDEYRYEGGGRTVSLLESDDGILAGVTVEGLPEAPFEIDTGNGHTVDCFRTFSARHGLLARQGAVTTEYGVGVGGKIRLSVATLGSLTLAGYRVDQVPAFFPRSRQGSFATSEAAGSLGAGVLSRFRVILDTRRGLMHVEPGPDLDAPFRRPSRSP